MSVSLTEAGSQKTEVSGQRTEDGSQNRTLISNLRLPTLRPPASGLRPVNPTPLLNRKAVRNFLLERAAQLRPFNHFERVSQDTLNRIDAELRARLTGLVQRLPSRGKTI